MGNQADRIFIDKALGQAGKKVDYKTFDSLYQAVLSYFVWCTDNPIPLSTKQKASKKQNGKDAQASREEASETAPRPYSRKQLLLWIGYHGSWSEFRSVNAKRSKAHTDLINACEAICEGQQVEYAMVGVFKENIVARLNGIYEKEDPSANALKQPTLKELAEFLKPATEKGDKPCR